MPSLVGSEMCIRDRAQVAAAGAVSQPLGTSPGLRSSSVGQKRLTSTGGALTGRGVGGGSGGVDVGVGGRVGGAVDGSAGGDVGSGIADSAGGVDAVGAGGADGAGAVGAASAWL